MLFYDFIVKQFFCNYRNFINQLCQFYDSFVKNCDYCSCGSNSHTVNSIVILRSRCQKVLMIQFLEYNKIVVNFMVLLCRILLHCQVYLLHSHETNVNFFRDSNENQIDVFKRVDSHRNDNAPNNRFVMFLCEITTTHQLIYFQT